MMKVHYSKNDQIAALEDLLADARVELEEANEAGDLEGRLAAANTVARLERELARAKRG